MHHRRRKKIAVEPLTPEENKSFLQYVSEQALNHEDASCGNCLFKKLEREVAQEMLASQNASIYEWRKEVQKRFQATDLHKQIQALKKEGKSFREVEEIMKSRNWFNAG